MHNRLDSLDTLIEKLDNQINTEMTKGNAHLSAQTKFQRDKEFLSSLSDRLKKVQTKRTGTKENLEKFIERVCEINQIDNTKKILLIKQAIINTYFEIKRSMFGKNSRLGKSLEELINEKIKFLDFNTGNDLAPIDISGKETPLLFAPSFNVAYLQFNTVTDKGTSAEKKMELKNQFVSLRAEKSKNVNNTRANQIDRELLEILFKDIKIGEIPENELNNNGKIIKTVKILSPDDKQGVLPYDHFNRVTSIYLNNPRKDDHTAESNRLVLEKENAIFITSPSAKQKEEVDSDGQQNHDIVKDVEARTKTFKEVEDKFLDEIKNYCEEFVELINTVKNKNEFKANPELNDKIANLEIVIKLWSDPKNLSLLNVDKYKLMQKEVQDCYENLPQGRSKFNFFGIFSREMSVVDEIKKFIDQHPRSDLEDSKSAANNYPKYRLGSNKSL